MRETFADRLRQARIAARLTQTQLAERIGVNQGDISLWERDGNTPNEYAVRLLAKTLGVDALWLRAPRRRVVTVREVIERG